MEIMWVQSSDTASQAQVAGNTPHWKQAPTSAKDVALICMGKQETEGFCKHPHYEDDLW